MSNAKDNRIKQLEEEVSELRHICTRQRDNLAAQQETIVQQNICMCSTEACLANIYGETVTLEDGRQARRAKIPQKDFYGVLDNFEVHSVREGEYEDGHFVITVAKKPQEGEAQQEPAPEAGIVDDGTLHRDEYGSYGRV